jgi:hypothetical protein
VTSRIGPAIGANEICSKPLRLPVRQTASRPRNVSSISHVPDGRPYPGKRTSAQPSMTFWFGEEPGPELSFSIYAAPAGKTNIAINFDWMRRYTNEATLSRLAQRLREISGVAGKLADLERSEFRRRPGLLIDQVFASPPAVSALEAALLEVLEHGEALESPFLD